MKRPFVFEEPEAMQQMTIRKLSTGLALVAAMTVQVATAQQDAGGPDPAAMPGAIKVLKDFPDWVTSVAYAPDGDSVAVGSYEQIQLFSAENLEPRKKLKVASGFARSMAFSPDGSLLAVGGYQSIDLWKTDDWSRAGTLKGHRGYVTGITFAADGSKLASSSEDARVLLWDVENQTSTLEFKELRTPIQSVAFSPDGKYLAYAVGDETLLSRAGAAKLINLETGEATAVEPAPEKAAMDVTFTSDSSKLLVGSMDEKVYAYTVDGKADGFFGGHSRPVNAVLVTAGDRLAISGSGGRFKKMNEVKFWNPTDGTEYATLDVHQAKVTDLALSPDGTRLLVASYDGTASVWDLQPLLEAAGLTETNDAEMDGEAAAATAATTLAQIITGDSRNAVAGEAKTIRVGVIGLDTSHSLAFTKVMNAENPDAAVAGCRVVAAYPHGSPDIESSVSRIPKYTEEIQKLDVKIVDSIDELLEQVDAVLLETNDGRPHLEQVLPVLKAGKPVFVDKPIAASLVDAIAIIEAAEHYGVPLFSSSSLRFMEAAQEVRSGKYGDVLGCDAYSPCSLEETHPDLYWYGIHGVETLFTVMGTGCEQVSRASTENFDVATGVWKDGRIGTFRGLRAGKTGYGGTAFCSKGIVALERFRGYGPLVESIVHFFKTGEAPVEQAETLEIYAFMTAADESKRQGGAPVRIEDVLSSARTEAHRKLVELKVLER
ncbi:Gfo/Idh/MocA family oxidoreductase [Maioricimonas rarisocia]|nr:Gfo/Idh/MocA family oxidoreductase [Maioricimonas rarisocia]